MQSSLLRAFCVAEGLAGIRRLSFPPCNCCCPVRVGPVDDPGSNNLAPPGMSTEAGTVAVAATSTYEEERIQGDESFGSSSEVLR